MDTRREIQRVFEAVVYAYEHDVLSAAQVLHELGEYPSDRELVLFTALLAVVERDAVLVGMSRSDHARRLISYYS